MRFELGGNIARRDPIFRSLITETWHPDVWIAKGYTNFDVICIGAGGGRGGGIDTQNTGTLLRNYGGEGGGGGSMRIQGLLAELPGNVPVIVGAAGANGTDHVSTSASTTDGSNGGYSSFNGAVCRASGGKGGKRAQSNSSTVATSADGGQGGIGNTTTVGGGAAGGVCGVPGVSESTDGDDGPITTGIGWGGGGGAGGIAKYGGPVYLIASAGGRGSSVPGDTLLAGIGEDARVDSGTGLDSVRPGRGGGAKASPLNGLSIQYGRAGSDGAVIIRLTAI